MDPSETQKWIRASELLEKILDLPESEQSRAADRLGAEKDVADELAELLHGARRDSVLDESLEELISRIPSARINRNALEGKVFGRWLLGKEIGRGGMSVVYLATRSGDGFEQQAALKILSIAFLGQEHVDSFLQERKILSGLQHPSIAHLIDGGITPDGAPYLVMEYIDGERVDRWCEANDVDPRGVVALMLQLCQAVAHAQRHLVVHRDISPTNVLVDHRGNPVLVDFGIAKLLGEADTGRTLQAFTPEFAAPEQRAAGTITTATDVYGLGMLLRHLLRDHQLERDLELIIHVATHDEPAKRYWTAAEMADDLQAWIDDRPVRARPDSWWYRSHKFARRHRQLISVAGVAALIAIAGILSSGWQAELGRREAEKHRVVADFMLNLFKQADLMRTGSDLKVTDMLSTAAEQAAQAPDMDPETRISLYTLIASGQLELSNYDAGGSALDAAGALVEQNTVSSTTLAEYQLQRGKQAYEQGKFSDAAAWADKATALLAGESPRGAPYFAAGSTLVSYLVDAEQFEQARKLAGELFDAVSESGAGLESQALVTHRYAVALEVSGEFEEAFIQYRRALELQNQSQPANRMARASILSDYGIALYYAQRFEEAEGVNRETLEIYREQFRPPHPRISSAMHNVAFSLVGQERLDEAIELLTQTFDMSVQLHGLEHIDSLLEQTTLGTVIARNGDHMRAENIFRENLELMEKIAPEMTVMRGSIHSYLADVLLQTSRLDESRTEYLAALELFGELPEDHVRVVEVRARLAEIETLKNEQAPDAGSG